MKNLTQKIILAISLLGLVSLSACGQTENTQNEEQTTKIENETKKDSGKIKFKEENTDNPFEGFNLADHPEMTVQKWNTLSLEEKAKFARSKTDQANNIKLANHNSTAGMLNKKTKIKTTTQGQPVEDKAVNPYAAYANSEQAAIAGGKEYIKEKKAETEALKNKRTALQIAVKKAKENQ